MLAGHRVEYTHTLFVGDQIDRFGYPGGAYLSPTGTLFTQRALPPQNLNTPTGTTQANYHDYCVTKPFPVDAGPIAPWFEQLGLGIQYKLDPALLPAAGSSLRCLVAAQQRLSGRGKPCLTCRYGIARSPSGV